MNIPGATSANVIHIYDATLKNSFQVMGENIKFTGTKTKSNAGKDESHWIFIKTS